MSFDKQFNRLVWLIHLFFIYWNKILVLLLSIVRKNPWLLAQWSKAQHVMLNIMSGSRSRGHESPQHDMLSSTSWGRHGHWLIDSFVDQVDLHFMQKTFRRFVTMQTREETKQDTPCFCLYICLFQLRCKTLKSKVMWQECINWT